MNAVAAVAAHGLIADDLAAGFEDHEGVRIIVNAATRAEAAWSAATTGGAAIGTGRTLRLVISDDGVVESQFCTGAAVLALGVEDAAARRRAADGAENEAVFHHVIAER